MSFQPTQFAIGLMRHIFSILPVLILGFAGACTSLPERPELPRLSMETCGADRYQHLVGQPATVLERTLIMQHLRIVGPDEAVTMDLRPDRLNFWLDKGRRIERVDCG